MGNIWQHSPFPKKISFQKFLISSSYSEQTKTIHLRKICIHIFYKKPLLTKYCHICVLCGMIVQDINIKYIGNIQIWRKFILLTFYVLIIFKKLGYVRLGLLHT